MLVWTRKRVFLHNTSTFPSSKLKVSWGDIVVGSMGDSSSEASAMVKSDKLAMLMDGDSVTGDREVISVSGAVTDSIGWDGGIRGSRSMLGNPRGVATGVALGSPWPVLVRSGP